MGVSGVLHSRLVFFLVCLHFSERTLVNDSQGRTKVGNIIGAEFGSIDLHSLQLITYWIELVSYDRLSHSLS